jgi:hypothetical protein
MTARTARSLILLTLAALSVACLRAQESPTPSVPQVAVPPLSMDQYVAELERASAAAADLQKRPENASQLRAGLPTEWAVQTPTGIVEVSTARLGQLLQRWKDEPDHRQAIAGEIQKDLALMKREAVDLQGPAAAPPANARATLKEILGRREFRSVAGPSWWDEMKQKFNDWLERLLDRIFGKLHVSPSVGSAISWTLIGAAFVIVVWLIARNLLAQSRGMGLHLEAPQRTHQSSREWVHAAIEAAEKGNFREAIHYAYWAAVYRLEEAGVWKLDATRTPREYLRLLKTDVPQRAPMAEITREFEVVWYGDKAASADDFHQAVSGLEKLGCHLP